MYCPNCGAKNEDVARFCEECGTNLQEDLQQGSQPNPQPNPQPSLQPSPQPNLQSTGSSPAPLKKAERKPWKKGTVLICVEVVLIAILCVLGYRQIQRLNDPKTLVARYMDAVVEEDWETAYGLLDLPSEEGTSWLTLDGYVNSGSGKELSGIINYVIVDGEKKQPEEGVLKSYSVRYRKRGIASEQVKKIQVTRGREKKWMILEDWKIAPDEDLAMDTVLELPPHTTAMLDGQPAVPTEDNRVVIPCLFEGEHVLEVSMEGAMPYSQIVNVKGYETHIRAALPYLTEETLQKLADKSCDYWNRFLEDVVKGTEETPSYVPDTVDYQREKEKNQMAGTKSRFTSIRIDDMKAEILHFGADEGNPEVRIRLTGDVTWEGQYGRQQWYSQAVRYEPRTGTGRGQLDISYQYDGTDWILVAFSSNL